MGVRLNPFDAELGTNQGRLAPAGWSPPAEQTHAFVLGADVAGVRRKVAVGDYVEASQTADWAATLIRFSTRLRPPSAAQAGVNWIVSLWVDGARRASVSFQPGDAQRTLTDLAALTTGLGAGAHTVSLRLELEGAPENPCEVELPGVYLDQVIQDQTTDRLVIFNRLPGPGQGDVPLSSAIFFTIVDTGPDGVDLASITVKVNGVDALVPGSGFQSGFYGDISAVTGGYLVEIDSPAPLPSDVDVSVRVIASTVGGTAHYDATYAFHTIDQTPPVVQSALASSPTTVLVTFSEPVLEDDAADAGDALNATNYVLQLVSGAPAVTPEVVGATASGASAVELELDMEMTPRATYRVVVTGAEDVHGNAVAAPNNAAVFTGYAPQIPEGRDFDIWSFFPELNQLEDDSGDLRALIGCWQEVTNLLLSKIDAFVERVIDPDFCDAAQLDLMLADLGNPFAFAVGLDEQSKRRLVQTLVAIYREKGTDVGIVDAIRLFMGIEVTITQPQIGGPPLGQAIISGPSGQAWVLGAASLREKMTFNVNVPVLLTADEFAQMAAIVTYMKRAATHPVVVQPAPPPAQPNHVVLGLSQLGVNWILHPN